MENNDYYQYVNSKDIRKYLADTGYIFNAVEAAWLIYQCNSISLEEKHKAFLKLVSETPDCGILKRMNCIQIGSLHDFIREYIEIQNKYLGIIKQSDPGWIYRLNVRYSSGQWGKAGIELFSSFDACWKYISSKTEGITEFIISKLLLDTGSTTIDVRYNDSFEPTDIFVSYNLNKKDFVMLELSFFGLWFNFPTPFNKGDIVWNPKRPCDGPVVITDIWGNMLNEDQLRRYYAYYDSSDMTLVGYFHNSYDESLHHDTAWNYMDYEYYPEAEIQKYKTVIAMSNYLKGKISLSLLQDAYHYLLLKKYADDLSLFTLYTKEGLALAGVERESTG